MNIEEYKALQKKGRKNPRWRNVRVYENNNWFDSKAEAYRIRELILLESAGRITDLLFRKSACRRPLTVNGILIGHYTPDAIYRDVELGCEVWEDVKSPASRTESYKLRIALVRALYGIQVTEIDV